MYFFLTWLDNNMTMGLLERVVSAVRNSLSQSELAKTHISTSLDRDLWRSAGKQLCKQPDGGLSRIVSTQTSYLTSDLVWANISQGGPVNGPIIISPAQRWKRRQGAGRCTARSLHASIINERGLSNDDLLFYTIPHRCVRVHYVDSHDI